MQQFSVFNNLDLEVEETERQGNRPAKDVLKAGNYSIKTSVY